MADQMSLTGLPDDVLHEVIAHLDNAFAPTALLALSETAAALCGVSRATRAALRVEYKTQQQFQRRCLLPSMSVYTECGVQSCTDVALANSVHLGRAYGRPIDESGVACLDALLRNRCLPKLKLFVVDGNDHGGARIFKALAAAFGAGCLPDLDSVVLRDAPLDVDGELMAALYAMSRSFEVAFVLMPSRVQRWHLKKKKS